MIKLIDFPFFALLIGVPFGLGLLIYIIPRLVGYPKTGKILTIIYGLLVLLIALLVGFEDKFFSKKDAKKLVEEQGIILKDDFELVDNKSSWAIGDYFHTFSINISVQDRINAIENIKNSESFRKAGDSVDEFSSKEFFHYSGPKLIQDYENEFSYIREYLQSNGNGYAPTFRRIMISKKGNLLTFQDIIE